MSAPDQWTALGASVGPRAYRVNDISFDRYRQDMDMTFKAGLRIGESKERTRQFGNLRHAYRRGRLDGFVRLGLAVVGLAAWAWVVGRK